MARNRRIGIAAVAILGFIVATVTVVLVLSRDDAAPARGDVIAYSCREQKNAWYAICVMRTDGTEPRRVTSKLPTTDPEWSPDGRRIAFTRNEDIGESTSFTSDDVYVMDADGGDVDRLTTDVEGRSFSQPTWSPNGDEIAFVDGESVSSAVPSRYGALAVMSTDGSDTRRLTRSPDKDPDWSPDGREIVFVRGANLSSAAANDDVYALDAVSGATRPLTRTPPGTFEGAPAWSPDGSRVAFVRTNVAFSGIGGTAGIYVVNRDGSGERLLREYELSLDAPFSLAWSPDATTIAFETSASLECVSISAVDVRLKAARALTTCARPREITLAPTWQPDTTVERG
jgi:Tol biopolymer transport system component